MRPVRRPEPKLSADQVIEFGMAHGLDAVGVAPADVMQRARGLLHERKAAGLHAGMSFTYKNPDRSTDPGRSVAGARSIVVAARSYLEPDPVTDGDRPVGQVARYAWRDHYEPLRAGLWEIARALRRTGERAVVFADDNSLVDREAAYRAGLGWFGKNANILLPGRGSWFVLGAVVTTADLEPAAEPVADGCGGCRRCLDGCPTGAIIAPGVVDANRCLAWLLQKPGEFPIEFRSALGDRLYGCDDCQEVCPPNTRHGRVEHAPAAPPRTTVDVLDLLTGTDDEVLATNGRWYLADRNPRWLRRNALVVAGNLLAVAPDDRLTTAVAAHAAGTDPMLADHARWALDRAGASTQRD